MEKRCRLCEDSGMLLAVVLEKIETGERLTFLVCARCLESDIKFLLCDGCCPFAKIIEVEKVK